MEGQSRPDPLDSAALIRQARALRLRAERVVEHSRKVRTAAYQVLLKQHLARDLARELPTTPAPSSGAGGVAQPPQMD